MENYTEKDFEDLCKRSPKKALEYINNCKEWKPWDLTYAAELAGVYLTYADVGPWLVLLLNHDYPVVREGAVLGLSHHPQHAIPHLKARLEKETSISVRAAICDVLDIKNQ